MRVSRVGGKIKEGRERRSRGTSQIVAALPRAKDAHWEVMKLA